MQPESAYNPELAELALLYEVFEALADDEDPFAVIDEGVL